MVPNSRGHGLKGRQTDGMRSPPIPEDTAGRGHGDTDQTSPTPAEHGEGAAPAPPSPCHLIVQEIEVISLRLPQLRILQPARRRRHAAALPGTARVPLLPLLLLLLRGEPRGAGLAPRSARTRLGSRSEPPSRPRRAPVSRQTRLLSRHSAGNPPPARPAPLMIGRQRSNSANGSGDKVMDKSFSLSERGGGEGAWPEVPIPAPALGSHRAAENEGKKIQGSKRKKQLKHPNKIRNEEKHNTK